MNKIIYFFLLVNWQLFSQKGQMFEYSFSLQNEKSLYEIIIDKKTIVGNANIKIAFKNFEQVPVALAQITFIDLDNNQSFTSLSDINGTSQLNLTSGKYSLKVEHIQFTKIEISEINVRNDYEFNINIILGYAWSNTLDGAGKIYTKTKLNKKNLAEIIEKLSKNPKIREVNGIIFTVSWQT